MKKMIAALFCGLLFGLGLAIAQMINPAKVIGFLDIAGNWDPSLAFVMMGALTVMTSARFLILKREKPLLEIDFHLPDRNDIDRKLILGAVLFGMGWGIGGFCPGPALASLGIANSKLLFFVGAMLVGASIHKWIFHPKRVCCG